MKAEEWKSVEERLRVKQREGREGGEGERGRGKEKRQEHEAGKERGEHDPSNFENFAQFYFHSPATWLYLAIV